MCTYTRATCLATATARARYINHVFWPNTTALHGLRALGHFNVAREPLGRWVSEYRYLAWGPRPNASMQRRRAELMELLEVDHPPDVDEFVNLTFAKYRCPPQPVPRAGRRVAGVVCAPCTCVCCRPGAGPQLRVCTSRGPHAHTVVGAQV